MRGEKGCSSEDLGRGERVPKASPPSVGVIGEPRNSSIDFI